MDIAILGGTGDFGGGLTLRWTAGGDHSVVVGSRDADRGAEAATRYERRLDQHGYDGVVTGTDNVTAAERAEVVVCSVPAYHLADTVESVADALDAGDVLVSPAVGMKHDESGAHYNRPGAGSVAALAARAAPAEVSVVGALHNLAAGPLVDLDVDLDWDTLVVGDDDDAVDTVVSLADDIDGVRPLRAGPLANAAEVESLTPLLINVARHNEGFHDTGVTFE